MAPPRAALRDALGSALALALPLAHLAAAPHSKVEESFALQAAHDVLVYGTPPPRTAAAAHRLPAAYDHFAFPGAVPRSFLGPLLLAGLAQPVVALVGFGRAQLVVRAVLAAANLAALALFAAALARACGARVARWWVALMAAQFHVAFYLSRTLPNMFAFGLTTLAFAFLLPRPDARLAAVRRKQAIAFLVFAAAVFRAELALLLAATALHLVATKHMTLRQLVAPFLVSFLAALALSVPLDSYFWQKPVWPELWAFYYNVVLGSSSNWGVSPWHYYFSSALPRLLLNPLAIPLVLYALLQPATSRQARALVVPSLLFLAVYSLQPHKEARFVFYVVPPLTAAAALGASFVASRRAKSPAYRLATCVLALSVLASLAGSMAMLLVSSLNYPGGDALAQLYAVARADAASPVVTVHADVLSCMTGLTLFGQNPHGLPLALGPPVPSSGLASTPVFVFDRTEDSPDLARPSFWKKMDYALMQDPALALGEWEVLGVVLGYDGIEVLRPGAAEDRRKHRVLGRGARLDRLRTAVRRHTGGWWLGPRMSPRIHIMKRVKRHVQYVTS